MTIDGATLGALICVTFGGVWAIIGATGLPRSWRAVGIVLSILVSGFGIALLLRPHLVSQTGTFRTDIYTAAVAFEVIAIIVVVAVLRRLERRPYIFPTVALIVGLHFLGMWKATDRFIFVLTAIGMCAASLVAIVLPESADGVRMRRRLVAGFGCALVLWATGLFGLGAL